VSDATDKAMRNPKAGDRFHEFFSYWVIVLSAEPDGGAVRALEFLGEHGNYRVLECRTAEAFRQKFAYGSIPGYSVHYSDSTGKMPLGDPRMAADVAKTMLPPWKDPRLKEQGIICERPL
jgi:hypothetical protein